MSYIVLSLLMAYIIVTSIFGLQQLGIWYFWVRVSERFLSEILYKKTIF